MNHGPRVISYYTVHTVYAMPETLAECLTLNIELPASGSLDPTLTGQVAGRVIIEIYPEITQIRGRPLCCVYRAASHLLCFCPFAVSLPLGLHSICPCLLACVFVAHVGFIQSLYIFPCQRTCAVVVLVRVSFSACSISFTCFLRLKPADESKSLGLSSESELALSGTNACNGRI